MNIQVYSNANSTTNTITFDFVGDVLASNDLGPIYPSNVACVEHYIKITTTASQDNGLLFPQNIYPVKIVRSLSDLALNKQKQSANNTANAYSTITELITDYTYDFINGHTANQFSSGCTIQAPMKFN